MVKDTSSGKGDDILNPTTKEDKNENMDTNTIKGDDTLETVDNVKNPVQKEKKKKKKVQEWLKPVRYPTLSEQRKLFGKALEIMLVTCMDNHVYQFDNKVRVQNKGGPIGLKLTGEIADCLMIDWDKKLLEELKRHSMIPEVYTRFKDDIGIAMESCEKGSRLIEDKIVIGEIERDKMMRISVTLK